MLPLCSMYLTSAIHMRRSLEGSSASMCLPHQACSSCSCVRSRLGSPTEHLLMRQEADVFTSVLSDTFTYYMVCLFSCPRNLQGQLRGCDVLFFFCFKSEISLFFSSVSPSGSGSAVQVARLESRPRALASSLKNTLLSP